MPGYTFRQTVKKILALCNSHAMLCTVKRDDSLIKVLAEKDVIYPLCVFSDLPGNFSAGKQAYQFSFFLLDRMLTERTNLLDVQSDMLQIAQDIFAGLRSYMYEWRVDDNAQFLTIEDELPDVLAGCKLTVTLYVPYAPNGCVVPTVDGIGFATEDDAPFIDPDGNLLIPQNSNVAGVKFSQLPTAPNVTGTTGFPVLIGDVNYLATGQQILDFITTHSLKNGCNIDLTDDTGIITLPAEFEERIPLTIAYQGGTISGFVYDTDAAEPRSYNDTTINAGTFILPQTITIIFV